MLVLYGDSNMSPKGPCTHTVQSPYPEAKEEQDRKDQELREAWELASELYGKGPNLKRAACHGAWVFGY